MEKYAIDLEKVLDDFEFREKQSHKFPSDQRTLNDTFGSNFDINENMYSRHYRTPATNYRRPPFEPMNLADADFSIASKSSSCLQTAATATSDPSNVSYPTDQRPTAALLRNDNDDNGIVGVSDVESSDIESSSAVASKYSCDFKLDQRPVQIDFSFTFDSKDYAPDLIESNRDLCANLNKFGLAERHLPDIASANIAASAPLEENDRVVDESSHGIVDSAKSDKQSSIKDESVIVARNGTPSEVNDCDSAEKLVSFRISNDVTDLALKQYLDELVENENLNSQHEYTTTGSDLSPRNDDIAEEYTEITEDCSYSTTAELEDKAGNDTECSSSDNFDAPKSSFSSENDNRDYHLLSDNVLLISSSVDSQENFDSDCGVHNDSTFNENDNDHDNDNDNGNNLADRRSSPIDEDAWSSRSGQNDFERELVSDLAPPLYHTQSANEMLREYGIKENNNSQSPVPFIETEIERMKPSSCSVGETANATEHLSTVYNLTADRTNNHETTSQVIVDENAASEECITTPVVVNYRDNFNASPNFNLQTLDSKTAILNFDSSHHHHHQHHYHQAPRRLNDSITPNLQHAAGPSSDCEQRCGELDASLVSSSSADLDHVPIEEDTFDDSSSTKPQRPDSLNLLHTTQNNDMSSTSADSGSLLSVENRKLGKEAPYWVPDSDSAVCMLCQLKFNPVIRRRHHCRACGMVVCAKCSDKKASLEYLGFKEDRVCHTCHGILQKTVSNAEPDITSAMKRPNPNNPMEYCSTIPPLMQVSSAHHPTLSVLVPKVGVLKREGRARTNNLPKQVIFSDGIRPGGDLTELDVTSEPKLPLRRSSRITKRVGTPPANLTINRRLLNPDTRSFIPSGVDLPPLVSKVQGECIFTELEKPLTVDSEPVKFAINRNLFVAVKRLILDCCVHKEVWCVTTEGMSCVGHDEIVFVLEIIADEKRPPKDIFSTINVLYQEASKGSTVTEMSFAAPCTNQLFESKDHGGFIFIRPTYQCVQKLLLPKPPFLVGLLIHRWETPWARLFPIRLVLRLGAEYRYYPCTLVSVRNRPALFSEIGHTIFTLLADFRKYTYTLPTVRGLMIHMEDKLTTILLPRNRYDQVIRALNNSEENVLAFAGNISTTADSHLVCIQSIQQEDTTYHTQAINILNKPRQVTGASFIVFNGSLKQCGWSGKSNIVEDGLMVQIPSESMTALRNALRQMKNYSIGCGPQAEEMVVLKWAPDDVNFNIGVKSEIDSRALDGVPSIRVHNGVDYSGNLRLIRWTEVFILQSEDEGNNKTGDSINISKLAESVAKATCIALVPLLDLLATANLTTLAVRASIHAENVGYEAGSRGEKLPPIYMKSLDEELIAVIHEAAVSMRDVVNPIVLELIFKVMEQG